MPKVPSPIKYFGAKSFLCDKILALFPPPETYHSFVDCFGGGGVVLLNHAHPGACAEFYNDKNGELENLFRVLREPDLFAGFVRTVNAMLFSERTWEDATRVVFPYNAHPISRAVNFFVRNRMSRSGGFKTFATLSKTRTRRGMSEQASAWLSAIDGLPELHERLRGVVLLSRSAYGPGGVIEALDDPKTVFYVDPSYPKETRAGGGEYEDTPGGKGCEMDLPGHIALLDELSQIKGKFLLSTYENEMYSDYATDYGWNCTEFESPLASAGGNVKRVAVELVYRNYK